jgi:hypothetical protein
MKPLLTIIGMSHKGHFNLGAEKSYIGLKCFVSIASEYSGPTIVQLVDPNTGKKIPGEIYRKDDFIYEQEEDKEYLEILNQL